MLCVHKALKTHIQLFNGSYNAHTGYRFGGAPAHHQPQDSGHRVTEEEESEAVNDTVLLEKIGFPIDCKVIGSTSKTITVSVISISLYLHDIHRWSQSPKRRKKSRRNLYSNTYHNFFVATQWTC